MALKRKQAPAKGKRGASNRGTGSGHYRVKGKRATQRQRAVINGCLAQAEEDGASRRVMVAVVMCLTQESVAGEKMGKTGNDDVGIYQQGRNWISAEGAKNPKKATHAFLVTGPTSWKKVFGGLKHAPGDLNAALMRVQGSVGGYGRWEKEAERNVAEWMGGGADSSFYLKRYVFTRGERKGQHENSWDAAQRLVEEVGAYRWAAGNVFYAVSGDELRRGAPALTIRGDEGWLRAEPAWSWSAGRPINEVTLQVLADHWAVMPGGMVILHEDWGAMSGRWMVFNVSGGSLESPEATVVLRRPTMLKPEPPRERAERQGAFSFNAPGGEKTVSKLRSVCREISANRSSYVYGGGHGPPVKNLRASSHMDCSSSVSFALYKAGFFPGSHPALVSGDFASGWEKHGKGNEFTVWANGGHVWIEFDNGDRFDTSQHSGKSGPAYTTVKRSDQGRFTPRHYPGH
jgi:hypothetical protein